MYDMCQHFNCLPRAGGLYDQDPYEMYVMMLVAAAQEDKRKADEAKEAAKGRAKPRMR